MLILDCLFIEFPVFTHLCFSLPAPEPAEPVNVSVGCYNFKMHKNVTDLVLQTFNINPEFEVNYYTTESPSVSFFTSLMLSRVTLVCFMRKLIVLDVCFCDERACNLRGVEAAKMTNSCLVCDSQDGSECEMGRSFDFQN